MTVDQAAAALGVSRRLAYRMIALGTLPCYRFGETGRKIVLTPEHVAECRRRHEVGVGREAERAPARAGGGKPRVPDFTEVTEAIRADRLRRR